MLHSIHPKHPQIPATTRFTGATFILPTSWKLNATSNSGGGLLKDESCAIELPCLPFTSTEVFVPSATTTLHLYEARFLALLEEAMEKHDNFFVHFVLDPVADFGSSAMASFAASYGCLTLIENVKRIEIGALVTIRGIGRVNIVTLTQTEPYLRGIVEPKQDEMPKDSGSVIAAVEELKLALADLHRLQLKLKTSKDEQLQTPLWNSLRWAQKDDFLDCNKEFLPRLAERISFAALQPLTGASASELRVLLQERLRAMESTSTIQRLDNVIKLVKESRALIAAKLALQSLDL